MRLLSKHCLRLDSDILRISNNFNKLLVEAAGVEPAATFLIV
jgi:hypothetical protein